ncbi:MAG: response regulator [Elusimicrobiales bacterium]|nr:response regulator [Elusimicrobiales bacterium]
MKVLIVDDSDLTRAMIRDLLTEMGHQVVGEACDGAEAVKLFSETSPELVLMDMIMPGKTGLEALTEIKAIDPAARVVMVTAVQQEPLRDQLMGKGAAGVLSKPFMYEELEAVLKSFS